MTSTELLDLVSGYRATQLLYVAAKLRIADRLTDGARSAESLAAESDAHAPSLYRVLRALAGLGFLFEDENGDFSLTAQGEYLRTDVPGSLHPFAVSYGEPWWWGSFGALLHTVKTGETAFDAVHGQGFFPYLEGRPEATAVFQANMTAMTREEAGAVVAAVDVSSTRLHVDVGGGQGLLAAAVLARAPEARSVVFDQPSVAEAAAARLRDLGIADRSRAEAGDFFASVPAGGDLYTLKDILHDWDDARALAILRNIRAAIKGPARLLVVERVIPPGNDPSPGKLIDITMMVLTGGRERTESEYRRLVEHAGFTWKRLVPTAAGTDVIEAIPA